MERRWTMSWLSWWKDEREILCQILSDDPEFNYNNALLVEKYEGWYSLGDSWVRVRGSVNKAAAFKWIDSGLLLLFWTWMVEPKISDSKLTSSLNDPSDLDHSQSFIDISGKKKKIYIQYQIILKKRWRQAS